MMRFWLCLLGLQQLHNCNGFLVSCQQQIQGSRQIGTTWVAETRMTSSEDAAVPLFVHHTAIKTRNITMAIQFYTLFGFEPTKKFRAGPARAAWLEHNGAANSRLELIEVPSYMLDEPEGMKRRALDVTERQNLLGYNHLALEVSASIRQKGFSNLTEWLDSLNEKSMEMFGKTLRVALQPQQQLIGSSVYELAFLYDADGALVELLHKQKDLPQRIESGWEPWDGKGFVFS
jgi:catechol 2,3-dioxygenase-like lactoylglutathione lyase family enzyme